MKKNFLKCCMICLYSLLTMNAIAQNIANKTIEVGNFKALVNADGLLFFDGNGPGMFNVPKEGNTISIFAANLWIGGISNSNLHMAAQTYRQTGSDFWPGPLDTVNASIDAATTASYNKIYSISKLAVDSFKKGLGISQELLDWPGNGDISKGISKQMAPYIDVNGDGNYDPYDGDYPDIRGDKMLWFVYNDAYDVHGESGGGKLGVEIQTSVYGYDCVQDTDAYNSLFVHYDIYNRSSYKYNEVYLGTWADIDLGYYLDDFIGSMVDQYSFYGYNGDGDDDLPTGYGMDVPAQSVSILKGPKADQGDGADNDNDGLIDEPDEVVGLSNFMYYNNDFSIMGNPDSSQHYYNYMQSKWKDGTHLTYDGTGYGGNLNCDYMFPGNSDTAGFGTGGVLQAEWSEITAGNSAADRRGLGGIGPFTFEPSEKLTFDMAYIFAQNLTDPNDSLSIELLRNRIQNVRTRFETGDLQACSKLDPSGVKETYVQSIEVFPNPAKTTLNIQLPVSNAAYKIILRDMLGREIIFATVKNQSTYMFDVSSFSKGFYCLTVEGEKIYSKKVFIEK